MPHSSTPPPAWQTIERRLLGSRYRGTLPVAILADGDFPTHPYPLSVLGEAHCIVCCDASILKLLSSGLDLDGKEVYIVGDLDTLTPQQRAALSYTIYSESEQDYNDLTKAFRWTLRRHTGPLLITIVGATGRREDHTLGNISLLLEYQLYLQRHRPTTHIRMLTDYGTFTAASGTTVCPSFCGQQVSVFSLCSDAPVTLSGLQYPLTNRSIPHWWQATLNSALGNSFTAAGQQLVIFQTHEAKHSDSTTDCGSITD